MDSRLITIATLLTTTLALSGCGKVDSLGDGRMSLSWQVSPTGCEDAGVSSVEVRVTGPEARIERYACERGEASFERLNPGLYQVELLGYDANGDATFGVQPRTVTIDTDRESTVGTMRLIARPASVAVGWIFNNGRVCGANDVDHVVVAVFDDLDYEVARERFPCDDGFGEVDGLRAGSYLMEATGLHEATATWRGTIPVKVDRGDEAAVEIELDRF